MVRIHMVDDSFLRGVVFCLLFSHVGDVVDASAEGFDCVTKAMVRTVSMLF